ncbi:DMT family transporter [Rhizobium sp. C4]|uniref:DMT family transporter n=1 Tax=Rhizobium sp. C4 TaxID=1349800 RepID=UPI001E4B852C|nr:DMT family transporter [Rhizobium sp. C4]MCD2172235.1 DMT family transporter [Rhizobium sp. C4]
MNTRHELAGRVYLGIGMRMMAALCFVAMAGLVKAADALPTGQILFARSFVIVPVLFVSLAFRGQLQSLKTKRPDGHLVRSILGCGALGFWFVALRYLPLTDVTAILYLTPILNVILAMLVLKETVGIWRGTAVIVGIVGVLIIMLPKLSGSYDTAALIGIACCLGNAICFSFSLIQIRQLSGTESPTSIVFYFSFFSSLMALATMPFGWLWPDPLQWLMLIGIGALGGLGQLLLTACYKYAPISLIAPFEYSTLLWATLIGMFFFGEHPSASTFAGAALIIAAGIVVARREHRLGRQRLAEETPTP